MDEDRFWALIDRLDWSRSGDDEAVMRPLVEELAALDESDIFRFDDILAVKLHALDGERYAREIGGNAYGGPDNFSPDLFLYARCCAVINGRKDYEKAVADPSAMPKDMEFESILYAAQKAYENKTREAYPYPRAQLRDVQQRPRLGRRR